MKRWTLCRDILLFFGGLSGVLHETLVVNGQERPDLLIIFTAMMGLPAFMEGDRRRRRNGKDDE